MESFPLAEHRSTYIVYSGVGIILSVYSSSSLFSTLKPSDFKRPFSQRHLRPETIQHCQYWRCFSAWWETYLSIILNITEIHTIGWQGHGTSVNPLSLLFIHHWETCMYRTGRYCAYYKKKSLVTSILHRYVIYLRTTPYLKKTFGTISTEKNTTAVKEKNVQPSRNYF